MWLLGYLDSVVARLPDWIVDELLGYLTGLLVVARLPDWVVGERHP